MMLEVQWFPQTPRAVPKVHTCPSSDARLWGTVRHHSPALCARHRLAQGVKENWSCSVGFSTQAPSPALMKAVNRRALAAWYSFAASLDSW